MPLAGPADGAVEAGGGVVDDVCAVCVPSRVDATGDGGRDSVPVAAAATARPWPGLEASGADADGRPRMHVAGSSAAHPSALRVEALPPEPGGGCGPLSPVVPDGATTLPPPRRLRSSRRPSRYPSTPPIRRSPPLQPAVAGSNAAACTGCDAKARPATSGCRESRCRRRQDWTMGLTWSVAAIPHAAHVSWLLDPLCIAQNPPVLRPGRDRDWHPSCATRPGCGRAHGERVKRGGTLRAASG